MTTIVLTGLAILLAVWFLGARYLRGPDLSALDHPAGDAQGQRFSTGSGLNAEHRAVIASLGGMALVLKGAPRSQHLGLMRTYLDNWTSNRRFEAQFSAVDAAGVPAEWVLVPGADGRRRTLYIHGGAYLMGSPRSHRVITARFAEITGGAVLAIDYRLMPEHARMAGVEDCRKAYRWMLDNGPGGAGSASAVFVAGDSAGGNLTLSLLAWVRDQRLRAPDAAVALSPATDATLGSPSLRANAASDAMLGPLFGKLLRVPRSALLWLGLLQNRLRPCNPVISPLFGDLSNLPPTLIHASEVEMLRDDCIRYANKAAQAGSPVTLQTWNHVVHVWHIFDPGLTEARQGFEEIRKFLAAADAGKPAR